MNFELHADRAAVRPSGGAHHLRIRFTAPPGGGKPRAPVHVAFVVDRSGSMAGSKLDLAKTAVLEAIAALRGDDRFAVVAYDDVVEVVAASSAATAEARREAAHRLRRIDAGSCTDLHAGWVAGADGLATGLAKDAIGRVLLLTDGLANRGVTDPVELTARAAALRARGLATSTVGLGADFDERLLQSIADAGGGRFYFVEHARQIPDCLAGELGEALEVVARDVVVEVAVPVGVQAEPLNRFPFEREAGKLRIRLGDLVSEQECELVVRLDFPPDAPGEIRPVAVGVADRDGVLGAPRAEAWFRHVEHAAYDAQERHPAAMLATARLYAARAREEALELHRHGDHEAAVRVLDAAVRGIRNRARGDAAMHEVADRLEAERDAMRRPMTAMETKRLHFASSSMIRDRDVTGRSRKNR